MQTNNIVRSSSVCKIWNDIAQTVAIPIALLYRLLCGEWKGTDGLDALMLFRAFQLESLSVIYVDKILINYDCNILFNKNYKHLT